MAVKTFDELLQYILDYFQNVSKVEAEKFVEFTQDMVETVAFNVEDVEESFMGLATTSTDPGTPTHRVFYLAEGPGTYTNFLDGGDNAIVISEELAFLIFNGVSWEKAEQNIDLSLYAKMTLDADLNANSKYITNLATDTSRGGDAVNVTNFDKRTDKYDATLGNGYFARHMAGSADDNCTLPSSPTITKRNFFNAFKSVKMKGFNHSHRHQLYQFKYNVGGIYHLFIRSYNGATWESSFDVDLALEAHTGGVSKLTGTSGTKSVTLEVYLGALTDGTTYQPQSGASVESVFMFASRCHSHVSPLSVTEEDLNTQIVSWDAMKERMQKQLNKYKVFKLDGVTPPTSNEDKVIDAVDELVIYNLAIVSQSQTTIKTTVSRIYRNHATYQNKLQMKGYNVYTGTWDLIFDENLTTDETSGILTFEKTILKTITGGGVVTGSFTITINYDKITTGSYINTEATPNIILNPDRWPINAKRLVDYTLEASKHANESLPYRALAPDAKPAVYRAMGMLSQDNFASAEVFLGKLLLDQKTYRLPYFSQVRNRQLDVKRKFVAFGWADFFEEDSTILMPLLAKYGFTHTFYAQIKPLSTNPLGSYYDIPTFKQIFNSGNFHGDHGFLHDAHLFTYPLYDGRTKPTNDELRTNRGDGRNAFGHLVTDTLNTSLGSTFITSYLQQQSSFGTKVWQTLTDDDCQVFRTYLSFYKCPQDYQNAQYILQTLDTLSARYCNTSGVSVYNGDYETRTPNTANGEPPSIFNPIVGGIFQGCAGTANHEIWERVQEIIKQYMHEVMCLPHNILYWATPGGSDLKMLYVEQNPTSNSKRYFDVEMTKLCNGFSKFESSRTGKSRSMFDIFRAEGYLAGMYAQIGYSIAAWDHLQKVEKARMYRKNASLSIPDYMGDGYDYGYRLYDCLIATQEGLDALYNSADVMVAKYEQTKTDPVYSSCTEYTTNTNLGKLIDTTVKHTAWGLIPHGVGDSGFSDTDQNLRRRKRSCFALTVELYYQFCKKAGIELISHHEAALLSLRHELPNGINIFPNPNMDQTVKAIIASSYAPEIPDGWSGGTVIEETIGTLSNVRCLYVSVHTAKYWTRWYGIQKGLHNLSVWAKGTGTLKVYAIRNKHKYCDGASNDASFQFDLLATITINNNSAFAEYTANWRIIDEKLATYSPSTPEEYAYAYYMRGMDDKVCGLHFELEITIGNFVKMGLPKLIVE